MVNEQENEANTLPLEVEEELEPVSEDAEAIPAVEADVADDGESEEIGRIEKGRGS